MRVWYVVLLGQCASLPMFVFAYIHFTVVFTRAPWLLCVCLLEQDRGLEALSHALGRQKEIGLAIGDEVEYQNGEFRTSSLLCL